MLWAIKVSKYNIEYTTRKCINANTLSDFIIECKDPAPIVHFSSPENSIPSDCWKIHVDDSVAKSNRGAGLEITSLKGSKLFYALKYTFPISNNESEYEPFLVGLRVTYTLHIQKLHIFAYSQVIVGHINRAFEAEEDNMQRYLQLVSSFLKDFQFLKIEHITRNQNVEGDVCLSYTKDMR